MPDAGDYVRDAVLLLLIVLAGFSVSGLTASFYQLLTGKTEFALSPKSDAARVWAIGLSAVTGPAVLAINAVKAQLSGGQDRAYFAFALSVVAVWSYALGLFVVSLAIAQW
jgi:hypothetical protein